MDFIGTREAARRLNITRQTLTKYMREGRVRALKIGKEWRIPAGEFERLLQAPPAAEGQEPPQTS
jgi:excisionase family DNA binding protein